MNVFKSVAGLAVFVLVAMTASASVRANLLTNGSFEAGPVIAELSGFVDLPVGSTAIAGWTVTRDEIDYIGTSFWQHADGIRSLDLNGTSGVGGIAQSFTTDPGVAYLVTFDLAGSPGGAPVKGMAVTAVGQSQDFSFDSTSQTVSDMGWIGRSWTFTADSTATT